MFTTHRAERFVGAKQTNHDKPLEELNVYSGGCASAIHRTIVVRGPGVCYLLCIFATFRRMSGVSLYLSDRASDDNLPLWGLRERQQQREINYFK